MLGVVGTFVQRDELAGGGVSLHLAIPIVIGSPRRSFSEGGSAAAVGEERGAFLERELLGGGLDFLPGAQGGNAALAGARAGFCSVKLVVVGMGADPFP